MVKKKFLKVGDLVKVIFELPSDVEGQNVYLVGDFNDWKPVHAMSVPTSAGIASLNWSWAGIISFAIW
jgi:hypothetical protein